MNKQERMDLLRDLATWVDCAAVLRKLYSELAKRLTCKEILPELYSLDAITEYEKREIEDASHSEYIRNQKILDFLLRKGKNEFNLFLQALRLVSRHDLSSLMYATLKEQLHVHRLVVVTSLNVQDEISEELVVLFLEEEINVDVERHWKLSSDSMVVCFREDKGLRKALEMTTFICENLHVRIKEPSVLSTPDHSIHDLDSPDAASSAEADASSRRTGGATTISVDCQAPKETYSTMLSQCAQPQTHAYDDHHAGNLLATNKRPRSSIGESAPFARLVFGRHRAASQCLQGQSEEFLSLLKAYKCSLPGPRTDWGDLLVLEYNEPFTLPGQEASLGCIAAAIDEFFCGRHES